MRRPEGDPGRPSATPGLISIVVPAYNESENLPALVASIGEVVSEWPWEMIIVDDGSTDDTFARIVEIAARDARVRGIGFSRNFGHQYALAAGLRQAQGEAVITMDADLQHPPIVVPAMIERWREGYKVVQAVREDDTDGSPVKRWMSRAFYRTFRLLSGVPIDPGMSDFRLLDRAVVESINALDEGDLFLRGLLVWMGHRQARIPYRPGRRHGGQSKYGLGKMLELARMGIFAFSPVPLRLGVAAGFVMSVCSLVELSYVIGAYLLGRTVPGWASTMALMSAVFAVLFLVVGIQGAYLLRIYERVQRRPRFIVERTCGGAGDPLAPRTG